MDVKNSLLGSLIIFSMTAVVPDVNAQEPPMQGEIERIEVMGGD